MREDNQGYKEELEAMISQLADKEGEHAEEFSILKKECEDEISDLKSQLI